MKTSEMRRDLSRLSNKAFAKKYGIKVSEINKLSIEELEERISKIGPFAGGVGPITFRV